MQHSTDEIQITDVVAKWKIDSVIDESRLNVEICKTPSLHSDYVNHYVYFKQLLNKYESRFFRLGNIKRKYYRGECTQEELLKYGWNQFTGLKPSQSEMSSHLEYDIELVKMREKIGEMKIAVSAVEYIMKSINGRDYSLKALQEYLKYVGG